MTTVKTGVPAGAVLQGARHVLFVEGKDRASLDPTVLDTLMRTNGLARIEVHGLGSCENIHQAAKAMVYAHSSYYFLIDRDGHDDAFVTKSWENFPDVATHNLLVWRRRELETYFIQPDYLASSRFLARDAAFIHETVLDECRRRLFTEAANLVLLRIAGELRRPLVASFKLSQESAIGPAHSNSSTPATASTPGGEAPAPPSTSTTASGASITSSPRSPVGRASLSTDAGAGWS